MHYTYLIWFILPPVIDLVNINIQNTQLRFWIALGVCIGLSVVIHLFSGDLQTLPMIESAGVVFSESQIMYKQFWEKSALRERLM